MADPSQVGQYVDHTYGGTMQSMSPQNRAEQLMGEANQNLAHCGAPAISWHFGSSGTEYGSFDASQWAMSLNEAYFSDADGETNTDVLTDRYREASQTIYHETRHAEQTFRCCQERAGLGATAEQIEQAMQAGSAPVPPLWVIQAACANPILQCDYSQYQAEAWYQSLYGDGSQHRSDVLNDPDAPDAYDQYRNLPEESDAWRTDGEVGDGYTQRDGQ
jgi:hypothetical protein